MSKPKDILDDLIEAYFIDTFKFAKRKSPTSRESEFSNIKHEFVGLAIKFLKYKKLKNVSKPSEIFEDLMKLGEIGLPLPPPSDTTNDAEKHSMEKALF